MSEVFMTKEAQVAFDRRASLGEKLLQVAWGRTSTNGVDTEDREMAATDAISDILTALYGEAGKWKLGQGMRPNRFALNEARRLVETALRSWEGDAEDYVIEPEPGEYGYEGD